jgi:hypothetical protein
MFKSSLGLNFLLAVVLIAIATQLFPHLTEKPGITPPVTVASRLETNGTEKPCLNEHPDWRKAQVIDGVEISESLACDPDNPFDIAAAVKGINNVSMATIMQSDLAQDAVIMGEDLDKDGDPDVIRIKLEVMELNGASPDGEFLVNTYDIAPSIQPGLWVYTPKMRGMGLKHFNSFVAHPMLRAPSPVIRVEQGDKVYITLENTHYLPHTIHLHGVDHAFLNSKGEDNDGMEEHPVFPGKTHTYEIQPRHAGTMLYHCHVQTAQHFMMGLTGMFVVEENRPNNSVQTLNMGAGQVRHSSVAVKQDYNQEYDLFYQSLDKKLSKIIQDTSDPRLVAHRMSREYNMSESFENYFMLNGRSFPYTLRESIVAVADNDNVKLRVANVQRSQIALHIHGHKATVTAMDGVDLNSAQQITRDVFDISTAQRMDISLKAINNGVNSYGPGLWMFHDHVPTGTTTDGMEPGGNMAIVGYKTMLDEQGMPKMHDELLGQVFNSNYYSKKQAVWGEGDYASYLGEVGLIAPNLLKIIAFGLCAGGGVGLLAYTAFIYLRRKINEN